MGYQSERKWSDRFLPEVTRKLENCLGVCGFKVAHEEEDVAGTGGTLGTL